MLGHPTFAERVVADDEERFYTPWTEPDWVFWPGGVETLKWSSEIPVKFLSVIDKDKCVNHKDIPSIENWSYGFRDSNCIKPNNE